MTVSYSDAQMMLLSGDNVEIRYLSLQGVDKSFTCRVVHDQPPTKLDYVVSVTMNGYPTGEKKQIYMTGILEINKMSILK